MKAVFLVLFLLGSRSTVLGAPPADHEDLVRLHQRLVDLETRPGVDQPDAFSPPVIEERQSRVAALLRETLDIDASAWTASAKIDYLLVLARCNALDFDRRVLQPWKRDPGFYLDAIRSVPFSAVPATESEREALGRRLQAVGQILGWAREGLSGASQEMAGLALHHLERYDGVGQGEPLRREPPAGIMGWYDDLAKRLEGSSLEAEAKAAASAVRSFRDWLRDATPDLTAPAWFGLDAFNWYLRHVRLMPFSVADLRVVADVEMARAATFLEIEKNRNRDLPELQLADTQAEYEERVREAEGRIRDLVRRQKLLTIPDEVGPMETDAFWRFGLKRHFWEELQYRDAHNNHIHASIPGHRFDMLLARKIENPIRAATRDGGRVEGWAFYLEEALLQAGLLEDRPRARELFYVAQLARAIRIPTELNMQSGQMDLREAIQFMVERVPYMEENLARYDLEIYYRRPTYGMNYIMGKFQLEQLLDEARLMAGADFNLGRFHDEFLAAGLLPISLIRAEMLGWDERTQALWREVVVDARGRR